MRGALLLNKVVPLFFLPLGISLILLGWGLARRRRAIAVAGLCVLLVSSNPIVGNFLIRWTEQWAERRVASAMPVAHAVVVLSAGRVVAPGPERVSEWGDANRFFGSLELVRAGRAPLLVFTGAAVSWEPDAPLDGAVLAAAAEANGMPANQIAVTGRIGNTAEEAREVLQLLRGRGQSQPHIILVTSAFHMPRARQQFEERGMTVDPFPVDFWLSEGTRWTMLDVLPSVSALRQTETALREQYGRAFYWLTARLQGLR